MASHSVSLSRDTTAAPDRVWSVLTDLESAPDTLSGVTSIEVLTDGPYRVGTRWRETRTVLGRKETQEMRVAAVQAPRSTRIEATAGGVDYVTTFDLVPQHPGTRLTMRFEGVQPEANPLQRAMWAIMGPIGARITRKVMASDLDDIVAAAEQQS